MGLTCCKFLHHLMDSLERKEFLNFLEYHLIFDSSKRYGTSSTKKIKGQGDPFHYHSVTLSVIHTVSLGKHSPSQWSIPLRQCLSLFDALLPNLAKMNVDAAINPLSHRSCIVGVLHDHHGKCICFFSFSIPSMEINYAKTFVIHRAPKNFHEQLLHHKSAVRTAPNCNPNRFFVVWVGLQF